MGGLNNRYLFLTVLEAGNPRLCGWWFWRLDVQDCVVSEGPLWEQTPVFSRGGRGRGALGGLFYKGIDPIHVGFTPLTQPPPKCPIGILGEHRPSHSAPPDCVLPTCKIHSLHPNSPQILTHCSIHSRVSPKSDVGRPEVDSPWGIVLSSCEPGEADSQWH